MRSLVLVCLSLSACVEPAPPAATPPTIVSLALRPPKPVVVANRRIQIVAQAEADNGQSFDQNSVVAWSVNDATRAEINDVGQLKGLTAGQVIVRAEHPDGPTATVTVDVLAADVSGVSLTPPASRMSIGSTQQLAASAQLASGSSEDVTTRAAWASNNVGAITVNAAGVAACVGPGQATIGATFLGVRGVCSVVCE